MSNPATDTEQAKAALLDFALGRGIAVVWEFVPLSKSRNAPAPGAKALPPTLNWRWSLSLRSGAVVITGDYSTGSAYSATTTALRGVLGERTALYQDALRAECETGVFDHPERAAFRRRTPEPHIEDLLHALAMDSAVLDYAGFTDWASDLGVDPDSRKGEAIYRECLDTALKLRHALGDTDLAELRRLASFL